MILQNTILNGTKLDGYKKMWGNYNSITEGNILSQCVRTPVGRDDQTVPLIWTIFSRSIRISLKLDEKVTEQFWLYPSSEN